MLANVRDANSNVTTIDADGIQLQRFESNQYEVLDGIAFHALSYAGSIIGPNSFSGWQAIHAGSDGAGGYNVLWTDGAGKASIIWDVDATGAWTGSHVGNLIDFEERFDFDINEDEWIGLL